MNIKGLIAGMLLAILILTITGEALDFNTAFSTVYGQVIDETGAAVNGANVSLTANGVTIMIKTMTNNRGEKGFYIFELANIPDLADATPLTLSVTTGTKSATTTIKRGEKALQKIDLAVQTTVLTNITVLPQTATVPVGNTQIFRAFDQSGNPIAVLWSSSNTSVGTIDTTGVFTARAAGTTTITAVNGTVTGSAVVIVDAAPPLIANITEFNVGNGNRAGAITANVSVKNLDTVPHTFVVVVSGVNLRGYPLAGTGVAIMGAGQSIRIPVLVTVPSSADAGDYSLYAGVFPYDDQIFDPVRLIGDIAGPGIAGVT